MKKQITMTTWWFAMIFTGMNSGLIAAPPERTEAVVVAAAVKTADGGLPMNDADLLWDVNECEGVPNPLLAPDGHQLTWGEYNKVTGRAAVKCDKRGTHVVMQVSGLIPKGVYTIWVLTFSPPGFTPNLENMTGVGALGAPDGSQNTFVASASGQAALSAHHPAGPLSEFGEVSGCLFDEFEFQLLANYHPDGQTYGGFGGPPEFLEEDPPNWECYFSAIAEHFTFIYQQE
jgi:hypothetical protein